MISHEPGFVSREIKYWLLVWKLDPAVVRLEMPLYFFDSRDNDTFIEDDVGVELPDLEAVQIEAARALGEIARDVLPGSDRRELAIEARDEHRPVLNALLHFEAVLFA